MTKFEQQAQQNICNSSSF